MIWQEHNEHLIVGKETPKEFLFYVNKHIGGSRTVDELMHEWEILNAKEKHFINWQLLDFIQILRKRYKVYVHSDTIDVAMNNELEREIRSKFDNVFVSYEITG